jgi:adenine-specific DNA-methyltransferase
MATLQFKGKAFVQNFHLTVKFHELIPQKKKSLTPEVSLHDNVIVHGDNLKALKALLPTYAGKVKCIYIDPPYNTGNENWAYNDNVNSPMMQEWLGKVVDNEDLTRHDKWLCMMMPRLRLLRELLRDDGVIFISIDDNEVHHLRMMMDEIFGEENFLANIAWEKRYTRSNNAKLFYSLKDAILVYRRSPAVEILREGRTTKSNAIYKNPDNDPRGPWTSSSYVNPATKKERPNLVYTIINPLNGSSITHPTHAWKYEKSQHDKHVEEKRLWWGKQGDGTYPRYKIFLSDSEEAGLVPIDIWNYQDTGTTDDGGNEIKEIFGRAVFDNPKPTKLLQRLINLVVENDDIILDSFAGSGTTAHAVLALNKEDGGNRKFILVETEDYADTLTAERVRRVIQGVKTSKDENLKNGLGGSFSYFELGEPFDLQRFFDPKRLPTYAELARYIFFVATGHEFDAKKLNEKRNFIGETSEYEVYLVYKPDIVWLKTAALTLDMARGMGKPKGKRRLVFAPTKYLDQDHMDLYKVDFAQLPFEIYRMAE